MIEGSRRLYFAGDNDLFTAMADLAPLDVALLPVAGWGPTVGAGHLNPERAARAVGLLRPRLAVPIHWGSYRPLTERRLAPEALQAPAEAFVAAVRLASPQVSVVLAALGFAIRPNSRADRRGGQPRARAR